MLDDEDVRPCDQRERERIGNAADLMLVVLVIFAALCAAFYPA